MPSTILLLPLSCSFKLHIFLCSFHVVFDLPSSLYDDPLTLLGLLLPAQKVERDKVWWKIRTNKQIARKFNSLLSCVGFTFGHMILDKSKNSSKLIPLCLRSVCNQCSWQQNITTDKWSWELQKEMFSTLHKDFFHFEFNYPNHFLQWILKQIKMFHEN